MSLNEHIDEKFIFLTVVAAFPSVFKMKSEERGAFCEIVKHKSEPFTVVLMGFPATSTRRFAFVLIASFYFLIPNEAHFIDGRQNFILQNAI